MSRPFLLRTVFALVTLFILVSDQVTKQMIIARMTLYSTTPVIPGVLQLTLVTNFGALFGLFDDLASPVRTVLFTLVPLIAIGLILVFQYRTTVSDSLAQTGLALILGGAIGNLIDRLRFGYVIDFLDIFVGEYHWPAFNVADSSICIGVALLFLDLLRKGHRRAEVGRTEA